MVHIIFDGSTLQLDNFSQCGSGGDQFTYFQGLPASQQRGYGGYSAYSGMVRQRGHGLGAIFRSIWRTLRPMLTSAGATLKPLAASAGEAIGKEGLATGARILGDMVAGTPAKEAIISAGQEGTSRLLEKAANRLKRQQASAAATAAEQTGNGRKRRNVSRTHVSIQPNNQYVGRSLSKKAAAAATPRRRQRIDSLGYY